MHSAPDPQKRGADGTFLVEVPKKCPLHLGALLPARLPFRSFLDMSRTPQLRIASFGLGDIARKAYLPLMATRREVRPVLCTRNRATLDLLSDQYRIEETYASLEDLMRSAPDAVMVHSATDSHPEVVAPLLEAGIPVFVDKPLANSLGATEALLDLARGKDTLLFVGFNRRYAPLISQLSGRPAPRQLTWHKNRVDLPGDPRTFLFDDFIHVVDGLRFLGNGPVEDLQIALDREGSLLANVQVRWRQGDCLCTGGMNRVSGITEERIEFYTRDHKWQIEELQRGYHYHRGVTEPLGFGNWTPTLEQRGFVAMLDDFMAAVRGRKMPADYLDGVRESHRICEEVLRRVERGGLK